MPGSKKPFAHGQLRSMSTKFASRPVMQCFYLRVACTRLEKAIFSSRSSKTAIPPIGCSIGTASMTKARPRQLHVDQALQCIDFNDVAPKLVESHGELLVRHELFEVQKWSLDSPREISSQGQFAIVCCLSGSLRCGDADLSPGEFFLVPAFLPDYQLQPQRKGTSLLRITIPT